jgi:hypothetical protein
MPSNGMTGAVPSILIIKPLWEGYVGKTLGLHRETEDAKRARIERGIDNQILSTT